MFEEDEEAVRRPRSPLTLAILAALPAAQVRALFPSTASFVRRHGTGPSSPGTLRPLLTRARTRGYAEEEGYVTPGMHSVAAPVLDHSGHPVAGLAVTAEEADLTVDTRGNIVAHVQRTAEEISRRLGHRAR